MFAPLTFSDFRRAYQAWQQDHASYLAAALAYTATLAIAPFLLIVLGIASLFYQQAAVHMEVLETISRLLGPEGSALLEQLLSARQQALHGYVAIIIGTIIALIAAIGIFRQLQGAANIIWHVKPLRGFSKKIVRRYITLTLLLLLTSALIITSTIVSAILSYQNVVLGTLFVRHSSILQITQALASFGLLSLAFGLLFKILPETPVAWKPSWIAGLVTVLLFNVSKYLLAWYFAVGSVGSVYGAAGSFAVLMIWIFYAAQIFFYGMELGKTLQLATMSKTMPMSPPKKARPEIRSTNG